MPAFVPGPQLVVLVVTEPRGAEPEGATRADAVVETLNPMPTPPPALEPLPLPPPLLLPPTIAAVVPVRGVL